MSFHGSVPPKRTSTIKSFWTLRSMKSTRVLKSCLELLQSNLKKRKKKTYLAKKTRKKKRETSLHFQSTMTPFPIFTWQRSPLKAVQTEAKRLLKVSHPLKCQWFTTIMMKEVILFSRISPHLFLETIQMSSTARILKAKTNMLMTTMLVSTLMWSTRITLSPAAVS